MTSQPEQSAQSLNSDSGLSRALLLLHKHCGIQHLYLFMSSTPWSTEIPCRTISTMLSAQRAATSGRPHLERACTQRGGARLPGTCPMGALLGAAAKLQLHLEHFTLNLAFERLNLLRQQPSEIEAIACSMG